MRKDIEIFDVDVHHFFVETIFKGKEINHAIHNLSLDAVIKHYEQIFKDRFNRELKHIIVWTDNAPHQYRCRQNFIKVLSVLARHAGINMTHRLAVVDNFKGVHDAVGKDPAFLVRNLELMGTRSKNAYQVFQNCTRCLTRTDDETKWKGYKNNNDERLKNKGRFGMNTRTCWMVVEEEYLFNMYSLDYPGRVLLIDRSFV